MASRVARSPGLLSMTFRGGGMTARWDSSRLVVSRSLIPNIMPVANTPEAMLRTARTVRVLLFQRSDQTLYQSTLIAALCPSLHASRRFPARGDVRPGEV